MGVHSGVVRLIFVGMPVLVSEVSTETPRSA